MGHLSLSLLGLFQTTLDGQPVAGFESNKVRALLAYLAVEADRPHPRSVLAALLWPDWPDREALGHLRHALANLRHVLGDGQAQPPFLLVSRETIQFNRASDYSLDLSGLRDLTGLGGMARLEQIVALYRGRFLEGFALGDSPTFEEWALLWRERLERQVLESLRSLALVYEERGEYDQTRAYARRQLDLEPWCEEAHRQLMRVLALSGRRSTALAQYETCRRLLAQELGVETSAETMMLYEHIRDGKLSQAPAVSPQPSVVSPQLPPSLSTDYGLPSTPPLFVARERELAQLNHFLDLALAGQGRVVFVTGDPGSGKTVLAREFVRLALETHPDLAATQGNGNAYTGLGDAYLPFLEIMQLLTGDIEARQAGGALTPEHARRLAQLLPVTAQALVEIGPELIDRFVPGAALLARAQTFKQTHKMSDTRRNSSGEDHWVARLDEMVKYKGAAPGGVTMEQSALFEQYTQVLRIIAGQHPLIVVLDDLQWADAGSISLLFHLGRKLAGNRILIVGAYRPGDVALGRPSSSSGQVERHPLEPVVNEFQRDWGDLSIDLTQAEGRQFAEAFLDTEPNRLEASFREMLYRHTGGHALFTVELLRGLQERGDLLRDEAGRWMVGPTLAWDRLPARVEAVIAEHIGRLPQAWQTLLTVASVEGEEFTAEVVARVLGLDEGDVIGCLSGELTHRGRLVSAASCRRREGQRLSRYRFRHYLFQKYLYNRLDEVERTRRHEAVGNALESLYNEQTGEIAVILAYHFEQAGVVGKTVDYLLQAGQRAVQLAANQEAIAHLNRGLELLQTLPPSPERDRQELALQLALGVALITFQSYGAPETSRAYARAQQLCQQVGQPAEVFTAVVGIASFYATRAEYQTALALLDQLSVVAQQNGEPARLTVACCLKGYCFLCMGEFVQARPLLEQMIALSDTQQYRSMLYSSGLDMRVYSMAWLSLVLLSLGYPDQARQHSQAALALVERELEHPLSIGGALALAGAVFNSLYRDDAAEQEYTEKLLKLGASAPGFFQGYGTVYLGRLKVRDGQVEAGLALIGQGLSTLRAIGHMSNCSHFLGLLAEGYGQAGQVTEGLNILTEALALVEKTDERFYLVELHRLRGELLLQQGQAVEAEASFQQAIEIARRQQAKLWELRATMSLARLWQKQGRSVEAHQRLAEIYGWFTEGFATPDLQEAKALLETLEKLSTG